VLVCYLEQEQLSRVLTIVVDIDRMEPIRLEDGEHVLRFLRLGLAFTHNWQASRETMDVSHGRNAINEMECKRTSSKTVAGARNAEFPRPGCCTKVRDGSSQDQGLHVEALDSDKPSLSTGISDGRASRGSHEP